jgi:hypothetical protein
MRSRKRLGSFSIQATTPAQQRVTRARHAPIFHIEWVGPDGTLAALFAAAVVNVLFVVALFLCSRSVQRREAT